MNRLGVLIDALMDKRLINREENSTGVTDLELFKQVLTASCYEQSSWQLYDTFDLEEKEGAYWISCFLSVCVALPPGCLGVE